ncbi:MAG: patatin family protein, partial [Clostridia bacterium]|nr:patatin family protein [Clostridia bacterium]
TAEPVYARINTLSKEEFLYLQASASMPLVSRPVEIGKKRLLDGGISDSIPLSFLSSLTEERRVLVLTRPKGYRKKPIGNKWFFKLALRKTPRLAEALLSRHEHYNRALEALEALEEKGEIFVLRPPKPIEVRTVERSCARLSAVHEMGISVARENMDALKAYLTAK